MPKRNKVPKRLAGVKLPKALRKSGIVKSVLGSQLGREIAANALVAAASGVAAAIVAIKGDDIVEAGETAAEKGKEGGKIVKDAVQSAASALDGAIGEASRAVLPKSHDDKRDKTSSDVARFQRHASGGSIPPTGA